VTRRTSAILAILAVGLATVMGTLFASHRLSAHEHRAAAAPELILNVGKPVGRTIPAGFLGLSFEYPAVAAYAGTDAGAGQPGRTAARPPPARWPATRRWSP
jgi:hypothetical protein